MSLAILFHFLCVQHVSDINTTLIRISIIRSLRLFCWITTLVVFFLVRCVLEFRCGWVGVVSVLQAEAQPLLCFSLQHGYQNSTKHISRQNVKTGGIRVSGWSTTFVVLQPATRIPKFHQTHLTSKRKNGWYPCCRLKHNKGCASACNTDTTRFYFLTWDVFGGIFFLIHQTICILISWFFFCGATALLWPKPPHCRGFEITHTHNTLGSTPLDEESARRRDMYLTTQNIPNRQTSMPPAVLEPVIPASQRPQTYA